MNYIVLFFNIAVLTYLIYVFHETYLEHHHSETGKISQYCGVAILMCFLLLCLPERNMALCIIGYMVIIPVYIYYEKERHTAQFAHYYGVLIVVVMMVCLMQYAYTIIPFVHIPFHFELDSQFSCIFSMVMLIYLKRKLLMYQTPNIVMVMVGFTCLTSYVIVYITMENISVDHLSQLFANIMVLVLMGLFRMFYALEQSSKNILKMIIERYANKENKDKYEVIEKENQMIMSQLHDMKKHLRILDEMNLESAQYNDYKQKIDRQVDEISNVKSSDNPLIERILQTYYHKFRDASIQYNIEIDEVDFSFMDITEMSAILVNLLDNAMESCVLCEERFLLLKIKIQNDFVIIKMKNSCHTIMEEQGVLKTMKTDRLYHGFGIRNMMMIAKKYDGDLHYSFDQEHQIFTTTITLNSTSD